MMKWDFQPTEQRKSTVTPSQILGATAKFLGTMGTWDLFSLGTGVFLEV
jgi:hypothetical protein